MKKCFQLLHLLLGLNAGVAFFILLFFFSNSFSSGFSASHTSNCASGSVSCLLANYYGKLGVRIDDCSGQHFYPSGMDYSCVTSKYSSTVSSFVFGTSSYDQQSGIVSHYCFGDWYHVENIYSGSCSATEYDPNYGAPWPASTCNTNFTIESTITPPLPAGVLLCGSFRNQSGVFGTTTFCSLSFEASCAPPPLPPCSDPVPIPDNRCNTGFAFWGTDETEILRALGYWGEGAINSPSVPWHTETAPVGSCNLSRPDGSQCSTPVVNDPAQNGCYTEGGLTLSVNQVYYVCSDGRGAESSSSGGQSSSSSEGSSSSSSELCPNDDPECVCAINPSAFICQSSSSSQPSQSSSSGGSPDICDAMPTLPQCECQRNPSLPWCSNVTPSSGSGGSSGSNSPANDLCTDFPNLIFCQSSDSGGNGGSAGSSAGSSSPSGGLPNGGGVNFGSGNGGNGNDSNGVTCLKNNNCNWARIDVQLEQLGVERDTRNLIKDIASLQQAGYNLTNEQNILLHSTLQAVNSGSADIVNAIDRLASRMNSSDSSNNDNFNSSLTKWGDMLNKTFGENGSKLDNISSTLGSKIDSLKALLGSFFGSGSCEGDDCNPAAGTADTSGLRSKANSQIAGGGKGFTPYTDKQINDLIPSKIGSYGSSCPVIDKQLKFYGTSIPFHMDFNDLVPGSGFNLAKFIRAILLISVYFINAFSMLAIFRSGGRQ